MSWVFHVPLVRVITFKLKIIAEEPLKIGAGREVSGVIDIPVLKMRKDGREVPIIPGSSLKGSLRSFAEGIWAEVRGNPNAIHHFGNYDKGCDSCAKVQKGRGCKEWMNQAKSNYKKINELEALLLGFCPACLTFGAHGYKSKIIVSTFYPESFDVGVRVSAQIHRKSGVAQHPHKVEYVEPGSSFEGEISLRNPPNWMIALVGHLLNMIDLGVIKLGGIKSRGFGRVRVEVQKVLFNGNEPSRPSVYACSLLEPLDKEVDKSICITNELQAYTEYWSSMVDKMKITFETRRERALQTMKSCLKVGE